MNDFYDWKNHPITLVVFAELKARIELLIEQLVDQTSTSSQSELAEKAGAVKAFRDVLNISAEDVVQETE